MVDNLVFRLGRKMVVFIAFKGEDEITSDHIQRFIDILELSKDTYPAPVQIASGNPAHAATKAETRDQGTQQPK